MKSKEDPEQASTITRPRKPTIHDVARDADVAVGTVSRFLNGRPIRISSQERIEAAIARLGFVKNVAAATIRKDASRMIGFLVSSYDELQIAILAGLTARMQARGRIVLPLTHDGSPDTMTEALRFFEEHRIEALIASGDFAAMQASPLLTGLDTHIILFNNDVPALACDRVLFNDASGMKKAVEHLLGLGHRRIGLVAGRKGHSSAEGRLAGYLRTMSDGPGVDETLIVGHDWERQTGYFAGIELLDRPDPPTAVICASYLSALGLLDLARERNISIPRDLSVISFGDCDTFGLIGPGIDALNMPVKKIVEHIDYLYASRAKDRPRTPALVELELIVRGSSSQPATP
ncbi:LacI family DNA-binding transcriptional regulator [Rhizobium sp. NRK18]|uniref:LacI family DNA-binding transcriptional regulator n=1 Tax=Rhizobium sp. NRK18 TaxID=2964667 RepID=UPI0021C3897B|nr:LacI family DNA-binding transcriptional regulator [Rhizobium sp. NRK18]MCQ2006020.1 LacI family transcriptional regulator [Rhizobium sp. NRK18]